MPKLNINQIGLSLAMTSAALYILCFILVAIMPLQAVVAFTNNIVHGIDIASIAKKTMTAAGFFIGLIEILILGYIIGVIFAFFYNLIGKKKEK